MKIQLSDEEFLRISRYLHQLGKLRQQIQQLQASGNEIMDVINTSWLAANQRAKLEDADLVEIDIPPMINVQGELAVSLDATDKTAEWESVHDAMRIAKPLATVEDNADASDETKTSDESEKETE